MFRTTFEGVPVQLPPATPGLVHLSADPVAVPEKARVPVHLPPPTAGALYVNVPTKDDVSVEPEIVPFQSSGDVCHVPDTADDAWVMANATALAAKLEDSNVPLHEPAMFAGCGGVGVVGDDPESPPQAIVSASEAESAAVRTPRSTVMTSSIQ
jgi:hypothetical protein